MLSSVGLPRRLSGPYIVQLLQLQKLSRYTEAGEDQLRKLVVPYRGQHLRLCPTHRYDLMQKEVVILTPSPCSSPIINLAISR